MADVAGDTAESIPTEHQELTALPLQSGRVVALKAEGDSEALEIRSPDGELELRISLTAEGPIVHLRTAKLQLEATNEVQVNCKKFSLHTTESTSLQTDGDMNLGANGKLTTHSDDDTKITGKMIYLN